MKIARVEAIAVALPMAKPMKMAGVEIRSADNLIVRVEGADGSVGWGEAASAPHMTGETVESMTAAVRHLAPGIEGRDSRELDAITSDWEFALHGNSAAKSALEMAITDLTAREAGVPVWKLLGGQRRSRVPVLWLIGTGSAEGDLAEARARKAGGYVAYKIKVGTDGAAADAARTLALCEALGGGNLISADANQGYTREQALEYLRACAGSRLDFLEQPLRAKDLAGLAELARASRIPIGGDEGIHSLDDIRRHREHGAAGVSLKTIKLGGLGPVIEAGRLCDALGIRVNLACKVAESSIATAAMLHLAAAIGSCDWGVSLTNQYLADDVSAQPVRVIDGHAAVPAGAGLGIEVDEARVRSYRRPL
jgi:muconate cycloisomerase